LITDKEHLGVLDLYSSPKKSIPSNPGISIVEDLINKARVSKVSGISFSEIMSGHIHVGMNFRGNKKEDYELSARTARGLCEASRFFLSVKALNTDTRVYQIS
jgi:hypothetical protein